MDRKKWMMGLITASLLFVALIPSQSGVLGQEEPEPETEPETEPEGDGEPEPEGDGEPEPEGDGEPEPEGDGEPEPEGDGEPEPEGDGEPEPEGDGEPEPEGDGEPSEGDGVPEPEGDGAEDLPECEEADGSEPEDGDDVASILSLGGKKCKPKGGDEELGGADALAAMVGETCDMDGMDEKLANCVNGLDTKIKDLQQLLLSGEGEEGGGLEEQITLVLVKKGVIDCENDTQCADDRACLDSIEAETRGRTLCEKVCHQHRHRCDVPYSECKGTEHMAECVCKKDFKGNGTVECIPEGFDQEDNGKSYKMFDDEYMEFDNATEHCANLGARLPVLDSTKTIDIIKKYLAEANFTVFEQWDRSSRRVWIGLMYQRNGLVWADGKRIHEYLDSSRLFVWEARKMLSQEAGRADRNRHYGLYIDGDIAKLPGGGRKGAAVLCELLPAGAQNPPQGPGRRGGYGRPPVPSRGGYPDGGSDGGYPDYRGPYN